MATRAVPAPLAQLPNALTILRLALIPVFVALVVCGRTGRRAGPAAARLRRRGRTDQVDGWLARRWHVESSFGTFADPLADRLMIDAAVILLCVDDRLPWPALALILARDGRLVLGYPLARAGLRLLRQLPRQGRDLGALRGARGRPRHRRGDDWPLVLFWSGLALAVAAANPLVWQGGLEDGER